MIDTSGAYFTLRYEPVYAKRLTINKGVDNVILFEFINQDEKPVNITGSTLVFRVVNQTGDELLLEKPMVVLNAQYGRAKVTIMSDDLTNIQEQPAGYSISRASGNLIEPVFVDAAAGARAPVDIVDSVYPEYIPSSELTIPTVNATGQAGIGGSSSVNVYPDWALQAGQPLNNYSPQQNTEFYSSFIEPRGPVTTIQMDLLGYTGTIKAQAAENYQSVWYDVTDSTQYLNKTGVVYMNVIGWHPILRLAFNNSVYTSGTNGMVLGNPAQANVTVSNGVVTGISIQYAGQGYQAPPLVEILGDGAGARAVATISGPGGGVSSITVTDGGSGYRPVPPTMQAAEVVISTGRAQNIIYR